MKRVLQLCYQMKTNDKTRKKQKIKEITKKGRKYELRRKI